MGRRSSTLVVPSLILLGFKILRWRAQRNCEGTQPEAHQCREHEWKTLIAAGGMFLSSGPDHPSGPRAPLASRVAVVSSSNVRGSQQGTALSQGPKSRASWAAVLGDWFILTVPQFRPKFINHVQGILGVRCQKMILRNSGSDVIVGFPSNPSSQSFKCRVVESVLPGSETLLLHLTFLSIQKIVQVKEVVIDLGKQA